MPIADENEKRAYQREWLKRRRSEWIAANGPCALCGSADRLEVDHIDPTTKDPRLKRPSGGGGSLWSWSDERRVAELAKCQVLCHTCHAAKSSRDQSAFGSANGASKLDEDDVRAIRVALERGFGPYRIAPVFGVSPWTVRDIAFRRRWKHV